MNRTAVCGIAALFLALSASGAEELLTNRGFSVSKDGVPADWSFQKNRTNVQYRLNPGTPGSVTIAGGDSNACGILIQSNRNRYPAGSVLTFSGEYRTKDIAASQGGGVLANVMCRSVYQNDLQPREWLNLWLTPSDSWKKFSETKRIRYNAESFHVYAQLVKSKGSVEYRNLSLTAEKPSSVPDANAEFIWREAEDIDRITPVSPWGKELAPDYYSGRGGVCLDKRSLDWNFHIDPVYDDATLAEKTRTWHLWVRVYGYLECPRILIFRNDKFFVFIDTPGNEKTDKSGKYAGPGKYTWVFCGSFPMKGGAQQLSFRPKGRMLIDSLLLTTDSRYAPQKFEAAALRQTKAVDISTAHMIRAEYMQEGVTGSIPTPVTFRIGGKNLAIPNDRPPAVFHFSLPEGIAVEGMTSHRAGPDWNDPAFWGKKFLTWKQTGTRIVRGVKIHDYEAYLYSLNGNQYMIFVKAAPGTFKPGTESVCEYYLEHNGEKQLPEKIALRHIEIKPARPFRRIFVGPSYLPYRMLYRSFPGGLQTFRQCGFNYLGMWHRPWLDPEFDAFRREAYARGFMISAVVEQYQGIRAQDLAVGMDGKAVHDESGSQTGIISLALDADAPAIAGTLERTRLCAASGISVEYDDELTNMLCDKIDYSPKTKELFRAWLAENRKGTAYREPELIVKEKKTNPGMYRHWVDFKCSRLAYWYSLYRKAFDEGLALAKGKYPETMKPMLLTCIQGAGKDFPSAESIRETGYLDYRLLAGHCDLIEIMAYAWNGVPESAKPAEALEMYDRYIGRDVTVPVLLSGGYGHEIAPKDKVMLRYQVLDSLMQKPKMIVFYAGATLFNAPTLAPVVEAMRIAVPYEDFYVDGERYYGLKKSSDSFRLKALRLGGKVLFYASNYAGDAGKTVSVTFPNPPKRVIECSSGKAMPVSGNEMSFDFKSDRGRLFLAEF